MGVPPTLLGEMWGHLPGREQCNYRAEVYALLMVLWHLEREGASNMTVYIVSDCKGVLGGWEKGEQRHFMEGAADLWRRITSLKGRLGRREVLFHLSWSRAHQTEEQMSAGTISYRDWVGNNWADLTAKKGAGRDALDPRTVSN